jgi:ribonuclease VapC
MFVDASAWTAILLNEPERDRLRSALAFADTILTSPIANWETVRALSRETTDSVATATARLAAFQVSVGARVISIGRAEQAVALEAHTRFGKGVHPARLNMGDCFAYACAKAHGVPLLFKGDDFPLTDIEPA